MTQQALADKVGCHVTMIRRYEANETQPTLEVIRKLAIALSVSADTLVFERAERDPDEDLRLQFEAVSKLSKKEKQIIRELIEGMIIKYETQRWNQQRAAGGLK